jgi:uncharacterized protein (DUF1697 family)
MIDLKAAFEAIGLVDVGTYIQSGNVLFSAAGAARVLSAKIEKGLSKRFGYEAKVVVISRDQLAAVLAQAPKGFGEQPAKYRYDVIFLRPPVTAKQAMAAVSLKEGVDAAHAGKHALYFSRAPIPWDRDARPSLDEVLALRADRVASVRRVLDDLTEEQLDSDTEPVAAPGWPRPVADPVRECLQIVLNEEYMHRLYAERDLDALTVSQPAAREA